MKDLTADYKMDMGLRMVALGLRMVADNSMSGDEFPFIISLEDMKKGITITKDDRAVLLKSILEDVEGMIMSDEMYRR